MEETKDMESKEGGVVDQDPAPTNPPVPEGPAPDTATAAAQSPPPPSTESKEEPSDQLPPAIELPPVKPPEPSQDNPTPTPTPTPPQEPATTTTTTTTPTEDTTDSKEKEAVEDVVTPPEQPDSNAGTEPEQPPQPTTTTPDENIWELVVDTEMGTAYYYNPATGSSRWEPPEGYSGPVIRISEHNMAYDAYDENLEAYHQAEAEAAVAASAAATTTSSSPVPDEPAPQPSVFSVARAQVHAEETAAARQSQEEEWIRVEFVQFEREQQKQLREEIASLEALIEKEAEKRKNDLASMLSSLEGLSKAYEKKKDEGGTQPEKKLRMLWGDYQEDSDHLSAVLVAERERQAARCKERVEEYKFKLIRAKVAKVKERLEQRRASDQVRLASVQAKFQSITRAQNTALSMAKKAIAKAAARRAAAKEKEKEAADKEAEAGADAEAEAKTGDDDDDAAVKAAWVQLIDPEREIPYYYNSVTGESSWTPPDSWNPDLNVTGGAKPDPDAEAAVVEASEQLATEWVAQEEYEYEKQVTKDLADRIKELEDSLQEARRNSTADPLAFLQDLMEEEEDAENVIDDLQKTYRTDTSRLMRILVTERRRQMRSLKDRLVERQERLQDAQENIGDVVKVKREASQKMLSDIAAEARTSRKSLLERRESSRRMVTSPTSPGPIPRPPSLHTQQQQQQQQADTAAAILLSPAMSRKSSSRSLPPVKSPHQSPRSHRELLPPTSGPIATTPSAAITSVSTEAS